jgi:hypothetical protein
MADHSKPTVTSTYANYTSELDGRLDDLALGFDPATTSPTNVPTNAIRWASASNKWQKWNGSSWGDLSGSYSININGTVGATTPAAGSFTNASYTGTLTGGSGVVNIGSGQVYKDASGNVGIGTTSVSGKLSINGEVYAAAGSVSGVAYGFYPKGTYGNTGMFSPAANTVAFATTGGERMRIDSSGNVGIGTSTIGTDGVSLNSAYNIGWTQSAGESVPNIFRQSSSAATVVANGYRYTATSNGFASSFSSSFAKSAISVGDGSVRFYTDTAATTAAGTDVTPTERMRIDSSGNVGIGTSSPNFALSFGANIGKTIALFENAGASVYGIGMGGAGSAGDPYRTKIFSNNSERIAITDAGLVGIGTTSPQNLVQIEGSSGTVPSQLRLGITASSQFYDIGRDYTDGYCWFYGAQTGVYSGFKWATGGSERMRIASNGDLLVGTTSAFNSGKQCIAFNSAAHVGIALNQTNANNSGTFLNFTQNGVTIGYISGNATTTTYATSSDYRLKEDWVAVADASTRVNALKPVNFAWIASGERVDGFLAHEVQAVVPEAVSGEKDAVNEDGSPKYQGIDQSKLVPLLTAALQEALAKIESLEARLDAANI